MIGEVAGKFSKCLSPVKTASFFFFFRLHHYFASWPTVLTFNKAVYTKLGLSETKDSVELEDKRKKNLFSWLAMKCLSFHFLFMLPLVSLPACMNTSVRKKGEEEQSAVANSAFGEIYKCSL